MRTFMIRGAIGAALAALVALLLLPNVVWLLHDHTATTWIVALALPSAP